MLTQSELNNLFNYYNGELIWKVNAAKNVKAGNVAGYIHPSGYRKIVINKRLYLAHRLVFMLHNGYLPEFLDHIDGDKLNNKIENLRPATRQQNGCNQKLNIKNTSGVKGVSWFKRDCKWKASLNINGIRKHLGMFDNLEMAELVIKEARLKYHGEYANHGNH